MIFQAFALFAFPYALWVLWAAPQLTSIQGGNPEGLPRVAHELGQIHTCFKMFPKDIRLKRGAGTFFLHRVTQDV